MNDDQHVHTLLASLYGQLAYLCTTIGPVMGKIGELAEVPVKIGSAMKEAEIALMRLNVEIRAHQLGIDSSTLPTKTTTHP